jgi:hypothetical protein
MGGSFANHVHALTIPGTSWHDPSETGVIEIVDDTLRLPHTPRFEQMSICAKITTTGLETW